MNYEVLMRCVSIVDYLSNLGGFSIWSHHLASLPEPPVTSRLIG